MHNMSVCKRAKTVETHEMIGFVGEKEIFFNALMLGKAKESAILLLFFFGCIAV